MITYPAPDFIAALGQPFLARRFQRLVESFVDDIEKFLLDSGLSAPARGLSTLLLIDDMPGLAIMQVARQVQMSHPLMINLLSQLEQLKLVHFMPDENDRRRRLIFLTEQGQAEVARLRALLPVVNAAYAELAREINVDLTMVVNRLDDALARRGFRQRLDSIAEIRADLTPQPGQEP
jgi:DNA-binding MarR family transcriptional regulator